MRAFILVLLIGLAPQAAIAAPDPISAHAASDETSTALGLLSTGFEKLIKHRLRPALTDFDGAIALGGSETAATLTRVRLCANQARNSGSSLTVSDGAAATLRSSCVWDSIGSNGAIDVSADAELTVEHTTFVGNAGRSINVDEGGTLWGSRVQGGLFTIDIDGVSQSFKYAGIYRGLVFSGGAEGCYADFDGNGVLDLFDFLAYVNSFNANEKKADCDGNGVLDLFDFLCYVNAFNAGC